jgi:hypothetical protein
MTHKEKAKYLVEIFYQSSPEMMGTARAMEFAIKMAIMTVAEIRKSIVAKGDDERLAHELGGNKYYWDEVLKELQEM